MLFVLEGSARHLCHCYGAPAETVDVSGKKPAKDVLFFCGGAGDMSFKRDEMFGQMPYRIIIPTNRIRRVSLPSTPPPPPQRRPPCTRDEEGHSAMMLYSRNYEPRLHSGRLVNMQGPGWPDSESANRSDGTPREIVTRSSNSSWHDHPRHPRHPESVPRHSEYVPRATAPAAVAAAFASPTVSEIYRESFTTPRQTAQVEHARRRLETEDDQKRSHHDHDPLNHVTTADPHSWMGMGVAASYDHDDPGLFLEDTKMESAHRFDAFPLGIHDQPASVLDYAEHDRLHFFQDFAMAPPLAHAREVASPEEGIPTEESGNDYPIDAPVEGAPLVVRFPQQEGARAAARRRLRTDRDRTMGRGHRRASDHARTPSQRHNSNHRRPSHHEMESCTTKRSMEALKVWYQRYNELVDYREEHGDCNVPQKYEANSALGIW